MISRHTLGRGTAVLSCSVTLRDLAGEGDFEEIENFRIDRRRSSSDVVDSSSESSSNLRTHQHQDESFDTGENETNLLEDNLVPESVFDLTVVLEVVELVAERLSSERSLESRSVDGARLDGLVDSIQNSRDGDEVLRTS